MELSNSSLTHLVQELTERLDKQQLKIEVLENDLEELKEELKEHDHD